MDHQIKLMGQIDNQLVPNALHTFRVFLVTSIHESFGVAAVEAMACEIPVIATDAEGYDEVSDHGRTCILIPKNSINSITHALQKAYSDQDHLEGMILEAKHRVFAFYDWDKNIDEMIEVYQSLIK